MRTELPWFLGLVALLAVLAVAADRVEAHEPPEWQVTSMVFVPQDQFHPADHEQMAEWAGLDWTVGVERWTADHTARLVVEEGLEPMMTAVAGKESRHNPLAHRSDVAKSELSGDIGLWQINYIWQDDLIAAGVISGAADLFLPRANARAAAFVFGQQGFGAWYVCRSSAGRGPLPC